MDDENNDCDLDQAEQDILTYDVSDEALEAAAADIGGTIPTGSINILPPNCC